MITHQSFDNIQRNTINLLYQVFSILTKLIRQRLSATFCEINPVVNNTDGSIVGYKYFNFTLTQGRKDLQLVLNLIPEGVNGTITVMVDRPWESQDGAVIGKVDIKADMPQEATDVCINVPSAASLTGKHAIFLKFTSETEDRSICVLNTMMFK